MRKFLVLLFVLGVVSTAWAQTAPAVEIVLSQSTAHQGDTLTADVVVRGAINVAGADVGITVDSACLRILDRQPGNYLPSPDEGGAFVPFSELNEHDTRLATALTDRSKIASGEGVFYTVQLEVTCDSGTVPLTITYAKLSTYVDPSAESISLISFALDDGTLNAINTELTITPGGQTAATPITAPEVTTAPEQLTATSPAEVAASATPSTGPAVTASEKENDQTLTIVVIVLLAAAVLFLIVLVVWRRRRSRRA